VTTDLPTGTVTFLFTDIEGSTNLARTLGDRWHEVLEGHNAILRGAIRDHGGVDVRTEGDSFFAVFPSAVDAVAAADAAQRELARHDWPLEAPIRVRMGMHTGEGRLGGDDYEGLDVHRAARIAAAGHGGQVLLSEATRALVGAALPKDVTLRDLGRHRLKDFDQPQTIHQLVVDGLPNEFPPLKTLEVPTNLPVQLTTFVGRGRELAELEALLATSRLLTLAGPGGSGKTRLAVEVAARGVDDHPDGVFFVDLSPIRDPDLVPLAIGQSLGLKERPGRPALDVVSDHLADRRSLLILDNFEQVVGAGRAVARILERAPKARIMVTSRVRLDLQGEQEFPVPPLGVPEDVTDLRKLTENEAVALFRDRARSVRPSFDINEDNAQTVAAVCARLDGLPLAIELAAAQVRLLSVSELLARLEHRLPLGTGAANVPERQRTLRSTIEWSYLLLSEAERRLFARLSVFVGGATAAAVDAVCNPQNDLGMETLDGLALLLDKSLVRRGEEPEGSRYTMLETIREYAGERLGADFDLGDTERRHAEFFASLAEEWGPAVRGPHAVEATRVLARDHENVRVAIDWSVRSDRADIGSRIAQGMWRFWVDQGPLAERARAVESILSLPSGARNDASRAGAFSALGALVYWQGDYRAAASAYREAVDISREQGDPHATAGALTDLAYTLLAQRQAKESLPVIEESMKLAHEVGDQDLAAVAGGVLGLARAQSRDYEGALVSLRDSLKIIEAAGSSVSVWVGEWRGRIGAVLRLMGRLEEAEQELLASIAFGREVAGNVGAAAVSWQLAAVASNLGDHERALRLAGFSESTSKRIGGSPPPALMLMEDVDTIRSAARAVLDDEEVERLWAEGQAMDIDQAMAYAVRES
jgi:predicted ATPase/class 3 adenylate cyclase